MVGAGRFFYTVSAYPSSVSGDQYIQYEKENQAIYFRCELHGFINFTNSRGLCNLFYQPDAFELFYKINSAILC